VLGAGMHHTGPDTGCARPRSDARARRPRSDDHGDVSEVVDTGEEQLVRVAAAKR
jgi:hypothetical protein